MIPTVPHLLTAAARVGLVAWLILIGSVAAGASDAAELTAILIEEGSVAESQVVALGRNVKVEGRAIAGVTAVGGSIVVSGVAEGDLVVIGGNVSLTSSATVGGDVFVLGGRIEVAAGATLRGRSVAYPTAPSTLLVLAEGPALGFSPWSPTVIGAKLALLAAWVLTLLVILAAAAPAARTTALSVSQEPLHNFTTGLVAVLALLLTVLFFSTFVGVLVGIPLLALVVLAALVLKLWGMAAVFMALGDSIWRHYSSRSGNLLGPPCLGVLVLGLVKFAPWLGGWAWTAATLVGVGATLNTKFGSGQRWFETS